jgi:hypothetical protein
VGSSNRAERCTACLNSTRELEHLEAKRVASVRGCLADVPAIGEARQETVGGADDEAGTRGNLGDAKITRLPQCLEHVEGSVERLHAVATWMRHGTAG